MMQQDWINALLGGLMIGFAVSLMLYLNGRVTGISGIIYGTLNPHKNDMQWRLLFVAGLFLGGITLKIFKPDMFSGALPTDLWTVIVAGLLVGFGTVLGSGCTSGHGVCGISRLSPRSLVATIVFIAAGIFSVVAFRKMGIL